MPHLFGFAAVYKGKFGKLVNGLVNNAVIPELGALNEMTFVAFELHLQ